MLLRNVDLATGLVNGSTGIVINFLYFTTRAPELPDFIIIDFPDYTGPAFFEGAERSTWVPLEPGTEWHGQDGTTHCRKQHPISLAWALTTWKAQGMTCLGKVYAPFPSSERQAGLTYVNLSRLREWSNLCIGKAIPLDKLTTKISSCKGMEERSAEDSRVRGLWDSTKAFYNLSR